MNVAIAGVKTKTDIGLRIIVKTAKQVVKITKLKISIYQDFINQNKVRQQRAKSRVIDVDKTEALSFVKMLAGYLKLDETQKIVLRRVV